MTDPIADMLTRIRNANQMRYTEVEVPASKIKLEIARILKEEGFIADFKVNKDSVQDMMVLNLKYGENKERVITGKTPSLLRRIVISQYILTRLLFLCQYMVILQIVKRIWCSVIRGKAASGEHAFEKPQLFQRT